MIVDKIIRKFGKLPAVVSDCACDRLTACGNTECRICSAVPNGIF